MKELSNTGLLVSVHHSPKKCANLEVFDVSRKGQAKKIYSFEEVYGSRISDHDLLYNNLFSDRKRRCYL